MPLGGAVIAGAGLLYGAYKGMKNDAKAAQIQKGLTDPVYHIPQEFEENRRIARNMAQIGIPQQQYNNQVNAINQNQATGISALNNSANPGSGVAATVRASNNATNTLNAEDAQARANNQRYFISQNAAMGNQELAKQQNDVYDKYTRDFNQMQAYKGAANQNYNNAINGAQNLGLTMVGNAQNGTTGMPQTMGQSLGAPQLSAPRSAGIIPTTQQLQPNFGNSASPAHPLYYGNNWNWGGY